ncbi:hypothetical protein GGD83_003965 [Rhodoblastus sphagnicola]|nr:hypothetical protein [Rhodoblastus sphagnicola]
MRQSAGPANGLSFRLGARQASLGSLDQQIALKFGDGGDNLHGHLPRRACEVGAAKGKTVNANAERGQSIDGGPHVHGVAAQTIKLCDDENVSGLQLVQETNEASPLRSGSAARDCLGNDAARLDGEAGGVDFVELIFGRLPRRRDADVSEDARHDLGPIQKGDSKRRPCSKLCQDNFRTWREGDVRNRTV